MPTSAQAGTWAAGAMAGPVVIVHAAGVCTPSEIAATLCLSEQSVQESGHGLAYEWNEGIPTVVQMAQLAPHVRPPAVPPALCARMCA
jgi:hypothetical protein